MTTNAPDEPAAPEAAAAEQTVEVATAPEPAQTAGAVSNIEILVPDLGDIEGEVIEVAVAVGDAIHFDSLLVV